MAKQAPSELAEDFIGPRPLAPLLPIQRAKDRMCAKHGPYQEITIDLFDRRIVQGCAKCALEHSAKDSKARLAEEINSDKQARAEALFQQSGVPVRYRDASFGSYRLCADKPSKSDQQTALAICRQFAENFADVLAHGGNLILAGNSGTGKTHLACAISNHLVQTGYTSMFVTAAAITHRIAAARSFASDADPEEIFRELAALDLLVIDEIEEYDGVDAKVTLIRVINERYAAGKPSVVITNLSKDEFQDRLSVKLLDRLAEGGRWVPFNWGSYRRTVGAETPRWMEEKS